MPVKTDRTFCAWHGMRQHPAPAHACPLCFVLDEQGYVVRLPNGQLKLTPTYQAYMGQFTHREELHG